LARAIDFDRFRHPDDTPATRSLDHTILARRKARSD